MVQPALAGLSVIAVTAQPAVVSIDPAAGRAGVSLVRMFVSVLKPYICAARQIRKFDHNAGTNQQRDFGRFYVSLSELCASKGQIASHTR
jgi:hypothetical protein